MEDETFAYEVIRYLIEVEHVDCLAVGEVSSKNLTSIRSILSSLGYNVLDCTHKSGRLVYDVGLIYRKSCIQILSHKSIDMREGVYSAKLASQVQMLCGSTEEIFHLYICHWPSRLSCPPGDPRRNLLGQRLYQSLGSVKKKMRGHTRIIVLGDFNDEPFDPPLAQYLSATRDRKLAASDDNYFYNPFWRRLGEMYPQTAHAHIVGYSGTCYHCGGKDTKWKTFDQVIVSSRLLNEDDWRLVHQSERVLFRSEIDVMIRKQSIFDHFPVAITLERLQKEVNNA